MRKAPRIAASIHDLASYKPFFVRPYNPPTIPTIIIPITWKGNINPANPQGEKKALINITKLPNVTPKEIPKMAPTRKTTKEVNSTFGGRGVNWIPMHKAARVESSTSWRVEGICMIVGWIIQPYKVFPQREPTNEFWR
ncbi:MAG: hypothetical protein ACUVRA_08865 [Candidatus Bathyarchaeaceae archaeon]